MSKFTTRPAHIVVNEHVLIHDDAVHLAVLENASPLFSHYHGCRAVITQVSNKHRTCTITTISPKTGELRVMGNIPWQFLRPFDLSLRDRAVAEREALMAERQRIAEVKKNERWLKVAQHRIRCHEERAPMMEREITLENTLVPNSASENGSDYDHLNVPAKNKYIHAEHFNNDLDSANIPLFTVSWASLGPVSPEEAILFAETLRRVAGEMRVRSLDQVEYLRKEIVKQNLVEEKATKSNKQTTK